MMIVKKLYVFVLFLSVLILAACQQTDGSNERVAASDIVDISVILSRGIDPVRGEQPESEKFEFIASEWQKREVPNDVGFLGIGGPCISEIFPNNSWNVHIVDDRVMVSKSVNRFNRFRFDLESGYFISENFGRHGGQIEFVGEDGERYTVVECNPRSMFSVNGAVYLIEGSHHRGMGRGYI